MNVQDEVLNEEAVKFIYDLVIEFREERLELLKNRVLRQEDYDNGSLPNFLPETCEIRSTEWKIAPTPDIISDRRVEITGPPDRKMIINALNSGAKVYMSDFEDSLCPTWENLILGQKNLIDVVNKTITFEHPTKGTYKLNENPAVLFIRPRGLHLEENHIKIDEKAIPASLFDFGIFFFHNAKKLLTDGAGPYFYLPKLEHHAEARWWNKVFLWSQDRIGIPQGSIKATVLIETLPAAFQMDEILYELKDHSAGLNCGRWDYIFSYIKTLKNHPDRILPNRDSVTMERHFMSQYSTLLIHTCHKRGAHAMGGMAAQIPISNNTKANNMALRKVLKDKIREVKLGHDGTWVAHPGLVSIAQQAFDDHMPEKNQINNLVENSWCEQEDLLEASSGLITSQGMLKNINIGIRYIESWLRGNGCVPLYNLMEDAATAEISRTQVWQWIRHSCKLKDGRIIDENLLDEMISSSLVEIEKELGSEKFMQSKFTEATALFRDLSVASELCNFLTLPAYEKIKKD